MVLQYLTLLSGMAFLPMISTKQTLVPFGWVPTHFSQPPKVRLVLNVFQYFVERLLKCHIYAFSVLYRSIPRALDSFLALCWNFLG